MEFIKTFVRENKPWSWILILFIAVPVALQMHLWPIYQIILFLTPGNHDTWIQFWGSYLGIIPSGIIAAMVASNQVNESNRQNEKNRIDEINRISQTKIVENWYKVRQSAITIKVLIDPLNTDNQYSYDDFVIHMLSDNGRIFDNNNYQEMRIQYNNVYRLINVINVDNNEKNLDDLLENIRIDISDYLTWAQLYSYKESLVEEQKNTDEVDGLIKEQFEKIKMNGVSVFLDDITNLLNISKEEILKIRN